MIRHKINDRENYNRIKFPHFLSGIVDTLRFKTTRISDVNHHGNLRQNFTVDHHHAQKASSCVKRGREEYGHLFGERLMT